MMGDQKRVELSIFWFRRDLRLDDNAGLFEALKNCGSVLPLFIFDVDILDTLPNNADKRVAFIHAAVTELHNQLLKVGSSMWVMMGSPLSVFEKLLFDFSVTSVYANSDYEPETMQRDAAVSTFLSSKGVAFKLFKDQVIFEKSEILKVDGSPFKIFTPYSSVWKQKLKKTKIETFSSEEYLNNFFKTNPRAVPTLHDIGFKDVETVSCKPVVDESILKHYDKTRNFPYLNGTSNLSVHLRFGTLSIRSLVKTALDLNEQFLNELIWREFFMMILFHFPHVAGACFKKPYNAIAWRNNEVEFGKWCRGETGYPMVDAGMRELNETGLMHNRVRMVVASFLCKHLLIDWRWGEAYFAEKLLDYELSSNNGNWQWSAGCGCDAAPYFRIFNPQEQIKKFDPDRRYIQKWVKNLSKSDYPEPIVEHVFARERCLHCYKSSLEVSKMQG